MISREKLHQFGFWGGLLGMIGFGLGVFFLEEALDVDVPLNEIGFIASLAVFGLSLSLEPGASDP